PVSTQNSLPAVGQTLLDGLSTRKVPTEGFRVLSSSHPPSPSLLGAIEETGADWRNCDARGGRGDLRTERRDTNLLRCVRPFLKEFVKLKLSSSGFLRSGCAWRSRLFSWSC